MSDVTEVYMNFNGADCGSSTGAANSIAPWKFGQTGEVTQTRGRRKVGETREVTQAQGKRNVGQTSDVSQELGKRKVGQTREVTQAHGNENQQKRQKRAIPIARPMQHGLVFPTEVPPRQFIGVVICKQYKGVRTLGTVLRYNAKKELFRVEYKGLGTEDLERRVVQNSMANRTHFIPPPSRRRSTRSKKTAEDQKKQQQPAGRKRKQPAGGKQQQQPPSGEGSTPTRKRRNTSSSRETKKKVQK